MHSIGHSVVRRSDGTYDPALAPGVYSPSPYECSSSMNPAGRCVKRRDRAPNRPGMHESMPKELAKQACHTERSLRPGDARCGIAGDVIPVGGMARWVQMVVLVAIAALLVKSQCYARCLASVQSEPSSAHSRCHHSSSSKHGGKTQCDDQHHSESVTAEA